MTLSVHQATVPVFVRGLGILSGLLRKGEVHASSNGQGAAALIGARLAPDMLPLSGQVQRASDTAKFAASRLTGTDAPSFADDETTFAQLYDRIERTVAFLDTFGEDRFVDSAAREVSIGSGDSARTLTGDRYVLAFALPNFFFHVTTAYDILRHNGVPIGKRDYLWPTS